MVRTVRDTVEELLGYLSPEEQAVPPTKEDGDEIYPRRIDHALKAVNGALQELFSLGALHAKRRSFGALVNAPETLSLTVTKGSPQISIDSGDWKSWFGGCTCQIPGADTDNRILDYDSDLGLITLLYPYAGETGAKSVTIWHDSLSLDPLAGEILSANLENYGPLVPANSPKGMMPRNRDEDDYGFQGSFSSTGFVGPDERLTHWVGTPQRYFVDSFYRSTAKPERQLRLFPLPSRDLVVTYRAKTLPPQFSKNAVYFEIPSQITSSLSGATVYDWSGANLNYDPDISGIRYYIENDKWVQGDATTPPVTTEAIGPNSWEGPAGDYTPLAGSGATASTVTAVSGSTVILSERPAAPLPIQNDWVESIFLPIAAQRFQASPSFRNDSATDEIKRQYEAALEILSTSAPQTKKGQSIRPTYG